MTRKRPGGGDAPRGMDHQEVTLMIARKAIAVGLSALVLVLAPSAVASGGYLHKAQAAPVALRYADKEFVGPGQSATVRRCHRRAQRVVDCVVAFTNFGPNGSFDPTYDAWLPIRVWMHGGTVRARWPF